jgi:acetyl esterase/lipase
MMKNLLKTLTFVTAVQSLLPFLKPQDRSLQTLLWLPKLIAGAFSSIHVVIGGIGALVGLLRKDWKWASMGLIGAGMAAKFIEDIPESKSAFEAAYGPDWEQKIPEELVSHMMPARFALPAKSPTAFMLEQNLVIGQSPKSGNNLLADLWQPPSAIQRSGLGIIYAHGSGWRVGDKDMGTRPLFQRLAAQGHVILDVAYSLWPKADIPSMVTEINQAIVWMKENATSYGFNPAKVVLMGGSAGGHLALLAAYTPTEAAFRPAGEHIYTTVCGVVAYYPPVDLVALQRPMEDYAWQSTPGLLEKTADGMITTLFQLNETADGENDEKKSHQDMITELLGGTVAEIPETYQLLSPIYHVDNECPPTLLLQGADDVFDLASGVRNLHVKLKEANVPVVWVEFPHTEHAFDLLFPQISPVAQAATYDVERFLAMLI